MYPDYTTVESQEFVLFEMTLLYSSLDHIVIDVSVLRRKLYACGYLEAFNSICATFICYVYIYIKKKKSRSVIGTMDSIE